jgi:alpha-1,4-digalacturonate transport system permease protein
LTSVPVPKTPPTNPARPILNGIVNFFWDVVDGFLHIFDLILAPLQQRVGIQKMAWFFVLPNLLIFGVFILLPMILNFYYAFTGGTALLPQERPFVGTANLERLFTCGNFFNPNSCAEDIFWRAVYNTVAFVFFHVVGIIAISLLTALALNRKIKARGFFRSVFFYPVLLSPVVVALIWKWILQRDGVLNALIVGFGGERLNFLLDPGWTRFWVVFISIWAQMGFYSLILLAGLQSIPHELYEAARVDGASTWNRFRYVTLPLLMPTLIVVLILSVIRGVQTFDQVYVLTGGGPGTATTYIVQYIYSTGFTSAERQAGLAAAASMVLAVILFTFTALQLRQGRASEKKAY